MYIGIEYDLLHKNRLKILKELKMLSNSPSASEIDLSADCNRCRSYLQKKVLYYVSFSLKSIYVFMYLF
jgi:hypothetical protein